MSNVVVISGKTMLQRPDLAFLKPLLLTYGYLPKQTKYRIHRAPVFIEISRKAWPKNPAILLEICQNLLPKKSKSGNYLKKYYLYSVILEIFFKIQKIQN